MANLKDIRKRIRSIKNTQKVTRAMKLVAAAKLRRAQENIVKARPYAYSLYSVFLYLAKQEGVTHLLLLIRPEKKIRVIILAGDRGLYGAFNTNIFRAADRFVAKKEKEGIEASIDFIGKRSRDYYAKRREVATYYEGFLTEASYRRASNIAGDILDLYLKGEFDAIYLVYNEFKSAVQQKIVIERLVPILIDVFDGVLRVREEVSMVVDKMGSETRANSEEAVVGYLFEPSKKEILAAMVPRHFKTQFYRSVLESVASEHGARMSAMENATKNASEMIDALTLDYNKACQTAITTELMEIVSGAEALK